MKALVVYDYTGKIWGIYYNEETAPQGGLPFLYVNMKEGATLERIDLTDPKNPKPYPTEAIECGVDLEKMRDDIETLNDSVDELNSTVNPSIDTEACTLDELKEYCQKENKTALSTFLKENPLQWSDGEYYGVSKEDQDEMIADKAAYDLKQAMGATDWKLEWHNIKKSCREFTETEFIGLLNAIIDFVYPFRRLQEEYKESIFSAETKEDLLALNIEYRLEQETVAK